MRGETRDEVLEMAAAHADAAHGLTDIDDTTRSALTAAVHPA